MAGVTLGALIDTFLSQQGSGVDPFERIYSALDDITQRIQTMSDSVDAQLATEKADIDALKVSVQNAVGEIGSLAGQLSDALNSAKAAGLSAAQLQMFQDVHTNMTSLKQALDDAVAAQQPTPAPAPTPEPAPAPAPAPEPAPAPAPADNPDANTPAPQPAPVPAPTPDNPTPIPNPQPTV